MLKTKLKLSHQELNNVKCTDQRVHEWEQNPRILFKIHGLAEGVNALIEKLQSNIKMIFL